MNTLAINSVDEELEDSAAFCKAESLGLEVTAFGFAANLDGDTAPLVDRHIKSVGGIRPLVVHGPFHDLIATSRDPWIVEVTRQRHRAALDAAIQMGASHYVAHTNFTPLIRNDSYRNNFTQRMMDFWLPFADVAGKNHIVICLENLWEPSPDIQADLIATANHPHLRASFDNGHALVFSTVAASAWVKTLGDSLGHCHLHDNHGEEDEHRPVGDGKEDWPGLIGAVRSYAPKAILVAESDRLEFNKKSLEQLRRF